MTASPGISGAGALPGPVPLRVKLFHGLGAMAFGVKDNGFSTFLLLFYNQVVGLDAKLVSAALMLAMFIDAFADPVIGHLSDRTYTRWGRRLPWLYIAPVPLALAWALLWMPMVSNELIFFYLVGTGILVRTLVSCVEVPSVALVPELTRDYDERTVVMRYRVLFAWAGGLLMLFLAYGVFLVPDENHAVGQLNADGYLEYGLFGAALIAVSVLVSAAGQHSRVAQWPAVRPAKTSFGEAFTEIREALTHPAFLVLAAGGAVAITSSQITFAISNYLYLFVWRFSDTAFRLYPFLLFGSVVAAFIVAPLAAAKFGKRAVAMGGGLLSVSFWITPFALRLAGVWPPEGSDLSTYLLFAFFFGANSCGVSGSICMLSMISDVVEAAEESTGRRAEGTFFAGWFFVQKCATGLGIGITGLIVSLSGLPERAVPGQVATTVIDTLTLTYCSIVLVAAITAATIFSRFPISRADHEARVARLAAAQNSAAPPP